MFHAKEREQDKLCNMPVISGAEAYAGQGSSLHERVVRSTYKNQLRVP